MAEGLGWRVARVAALRPLTPTIRSVALDVPGWPGHRAGQHVSVRLTAPDGYSAQRDYSVASRDDGAQRIEIAVERLDDGEVSPFLHDELRTGDEIELAGPFGGHFVWTPADGGPVVLMGGGSGVVPLMAMLRERAARAPQVPMALLLSVRTWADVPFRDELLALDTVMPVLRLQTTREAPRRPGDRGGRIDGAAVREVLALLPAPPRLAYACGSTGFVERALALLLEEGVPAAAIRAERYGGA